MKKILTTIQKIFKLKQASKQASKQYLSKKGGKLLFNLSPKELRGGYRLATEVAL